MEPENPETPPAASFRAPPFCDVVMKGGVTSGVTYPHAVTALARKFHLKNVGGTSAGAIAAACAAAAEYRRRKSPEFDDMSGFEALDQMPEYLGRDGHLRQLFRPDPANRPLFDLALRGATYERARIPRVLLRSFRHWPWTLGLALLPGIAMVIFSVLAGIEGSPPWLSIAGILGGIFLALGLGGFMLYRHLRAQVEALVDNGFGMCSGMAIAPHDEASSLSLWLHQKLQKVADLDGRPLTFGDLWSAPVPPAGRDLLKEGEHSIELKMITSCLTHGRPYELPFQENSLYFKEKELARVFPPDVVEWMAKHPRPAGAGDRIDEGEWCRMPDARDLPVVVATRMSLSFPGLISAVPLGRVDFGRKLPRGRKFEPERLWFSDGGISSNFPIHFFDALVPRWPTIAINLRQFSPDPATDRGARRESNVYAIKRRSDGTTEQWRRIQAATPLGKTMSFFQAILDTMQNWVDNAYLPLPGYRDRVVEIWQTKHEGGLNLDMDEKTVRRLAHKGRRAGQLMAQRFTKASSAEFQLGWDDHRWTRYRSSMAALADAHHGLHRVLHGSLEWERLIRQGHQQPPIGGRFESETQAQQAWKATNQLLDLYDDWYAAGTMVETQLGPFRRPPRPRLKLGTKAWS